MSLRLGVIRGAFSLGSARVAVSILNALGILVLARLLTPEDFGIVAIATAIITVVASLTEASLQPALIQNENPDRALVDTVWTMALIRALLIYGIVALAAWPLSIAYSDERLFDVLLVAGATGALMDFFNPQVTLATRSMRFGPLVTFQIAQKACGLVVAVVLALVFRSYWSIILGTAVGAVFASLLSFALVPYRPRLTLVRAREVWDFSGWMFLYQLCETINWRFDQLAIGLNTTKAQLGIYSMAENLAVIPSREMALPLRNALFPGLSAIGRQHDKLRKAFMEAQSGVAMLTAPAVIGLAVLAEPAVDVLLGRQWSAAVPLVQFLCLNYAIDTFITTVRPLGMAMGQTRYLFLRALVGMSARVVLILTGYLMFGLVGAAAGRAMGSLANSMISFRVARHLIGIPVSRQLAGHMPTIAGLVLMSVVVAATRSSLPPQILESDILELVLLVPLGALTYAATQWAIWQFSGKPHGAFREVMLVLGRLPGCGAIQRHAGA